MPHIANNNFTILVIIMMSMTVQINAFTTLNECSPNRFTFERLHLECMVYYSPEIIIDLRAFKMVVAE